MKYRHRLIWIVSILTLIFLINCSKNNKNVTAKPRLAVVLVVDQMRADYLDRFQDVYTGGLHRILQEGVKFDQAYHDHAHTETAVGHTVISTGAYPKHNGIVANHWFDRVSAKVIYCVDDAAEKELANPKRAGQSPHRLQRPALGDWLKSASPESHVFSVAMKDRAAILMGGRHPDAAFWYHKESGTITTSSYYMKSLPQWVQEFNQQKLLDPYFKTGWQRLLAEGQYSASREDAYPHEADGKHISFPHQLGNDGDKPDASFYRAIYGSPFGDEFILKFAREIVKANQLGQDDTPDVLFLSCSAADVIGHAFGPYSQEIEDYYLRLDQYLDAFLSFLDETVGKENYLAVLSSDHGALPLPEELQRRGIQARRVPPNVLRKNITAALESACKPYGLPARKMLLNLESGIYLNMNLLKSKNTDQTAFFSSLREALQKADPIAAAYTADELAKNQNNSNDAYFRLYENNYNPANSADVELRLKKYVLVSGGSTGTGHGTPYDYDRHVPIVFFGNGIPHTVTTDTVRTIDIAPTMADLLGILPPAGTDGVSLVPSWK